MAQAGQGAASASDVGKRYDVVIDGWGYRLLESVEPSLPFRSHRGIYGFTPTFIERQNTSGNFGDEQQAFWLTAAQNDWSLGEGQRFLRVNDTTSERRYWQSSGADIAIPGQVTMKHALGTFASPETIEASCPLPGTSFFAMQKHAFATGTSFFTVDATFSPTTATLIGLHGAGLGVSRGGLCGDDTYVYIAGGNKIQKWDGTTFTSFSTTAGAGALATLNNALYSMSQSTLRTYSTTGIATTLFNWQNNVGGLVAPVASPLITPFGGDLLVFFPRLLDRAQLWLYDGTAPAMIADFPSSFIGFDVEVVSGIIFVSGVIQDAPGNSSIGATPIIYYYNNGEVGELWRSQMGTTDLADNYSIYSPALGNYSGRLIFTDPSAGPYINEYDLGTGAITTLGTYSFNFGGSPAIPMISSNPRSVLLTHNTNVPIPDCVIYPYAPSFATTATVDSSLIDFESTLVKNLHGVRADWAGGGSVDLSYQLETLTGGYTSLALSVVSGQEYLFPAGTQGHAVSIRATLNRSGTNLPTLKRVYLRAAPLQPAFRINTYILDLSGIENRDDPVTLLDGTSHPLTGHQQGKNLNATILKTTPFTVTDRFGTFTAVCELSSEQTEIYDWRQGNDNPKWSGGFVGKVTVREV